VRISGVRTLLGWRSPSSQTYMATACFEATLEAIADSSAAELWCLGDLVGYGAEPDACVALARAHAAVCLAGNHDLARDRRHTAG